ncbi:MAG: TRAP transporter substrate-binding protein DctP [bacterium]
MSISKLFFIGLMLLAVEVQASTIKIATSAPDGTSWMKEMRAMAARVKQKSDGRVKLKYYPAGVMGNDATVLRKIRVGQLQGGAFTSGSLAQLSPSLEIFSVPFLFQNNAEVQAVKKQLKDSIESEMKSKNMVLLGMSGGGFAYPMSSKDFSKGKGLVGRKVWVPPGDDLSVQGVQLAKGQPVVLPISDVYTSLQTGLIDTVVTVETGAVAFQWYTRLSSMVDVPVAYVYGMLTVNKRVFDKLSDDDQALLVAEVQQSFAKLEAQNIEDNKAARKTLVKEGINLVKPTETMKQWQDIASKAIQQIKQNPDFPIAQLEKAESIINTFR